MKKYLKMLFFILCPIITSAQLKGSISGILIDNYDHKNLIPYATVSVYEKDSTLYSYKLSDTKGAFKISGLKIGQLYKVVITAFQYNTLRKEINISFNNFNVNLDSIFLGKSTNILKEVIIKSERPPIIVRNDTIEFNAESFKTLPTAVVEDLLKKLNGIQINRNGDIKFNGKAVSRILVEGKEFFDGKIQIASKNLPANIVEKVQITDDIEFKRVNPDANIGTVPQVINLTLKKNVKNGGFGRIYAGGALKNYYEVGGILNLFSDTSQVSILGYKNNISKTAFSLGELQSAGGFDRSGYSSLSTGFGGGFLIDNISFGGYGEGVQKPSGSGANFNTVTKNGLKINSKYFYGKNDVRIEQKSDELQFLQNTYLNTQKTSVGSNKSESHNISAKIVYNPNSKKRYTFLPSLEISPKKMNTIQNKDVFNEAGQLINNSELKNNRSIFNTALKLSGDYSQDYIKKGRRFFTAVTATFRDNKDEFINKSNILLKPSGTSQLTDQLRLTAIENVEIGLRSSFSEPLSKKLKLNFNFDGGYFDKENALTTYYKNTNNQQHTLIVPDLSETVVQKGFKSNTTSKLIWSVSDNLSIQPALIYGTIKINNQFTQRAGFEQKYNFLNPGLNIQYKNFSIQYEKTFSEPLAQYIQPISNNTDPLFLQLGNPNLLPTRTHRLYVFFRKYNVEKSINYNMYVNASTDNDGVIMTRGVDANGIQFTYPVNIQIQQVSHNSSLTKTIKNNSRQITLNAGYNFNLFDTPLEINGLKSNSLRYIVGTDIGIRINLNDKIELLESYSISFESSNFKSALYKNINTYTHYNELEMVARWPKNFVFETNLSLQYNNQNSIDNDKLIEIWNISCTYLFMKNDRAQLKFSANDLLQNNIRRYISIAENYRTKTQYNNIGRYGMVTLSYNIQNYKPKIGGKERFLGF